MADSPDTPYVQAPLSMVQPDLKSWPIYQLSKNKAQLKADVIAESMAKLHSGDARLDLNLVADTYYQEIKRIKEEPWKVDPPDEEAYYRQIKKEMQGAAAGNEGDPAIARELMEKLVERYTGEIVGSFKLQTYRLARRLANFGFARLFNTFSKDLLRPIKVQQRQLMQRMQITGEIDRIRHLATKGTVILVPTHFSNLDSIVIGWAIEALGLPPFTYGAGINLFGHPLLSYFMHRLGAYRLDRRKKTHLYLTVLKTYAEYIVRSGAHTLFFPGGTRSRSGGIETKLKLGLLGTTVEAQRKLILENPENPRTLYIVPLVMTYHNVLEGQSLIDQYLKREGKQRYFLVKDDFRSLNKNLRFVWNFIRGSSEMTFSFGEPHDLFGNRLDEEGRSIDRLGRRIDLADYFRRDGEVTYDAQRNKAYTRILGEHILKEYYAINIVFNSHLVAFAAFQYIQQSQGIDKFRLFTRNETKMIIPEDKFLEILDRLLGKLRELRSQGKVKLATHLDKSTTEILSEGISNLSGYHVQKPIVRMPNGNITTENIKLLYFYHNRLKGYELHRYIF